MLIASLATYSMTTTAKSGGIDHGLCFAAATKLRTVMWEFADEDIAQDLLDDIAPFAEQVPETIATQLSSVEVSALQDRIHKVLETGTYPRDVTGRRFPGRSSKRWSWV